MNIKKIFGDYGLIFLLLGIIIGLGISVGVDAYAIKDSPKVSNSINFTPSSVPNSQEEIINNCRNLDLINTSLCFRDNIKTFYNYSNDNLEYKSINGNYYLVERSDSWESSSPTNIKLLDYLKENGGVCTEWSLLYFEICKKTNFDCSEVTNGGVWNVFDGHRYAIMYNSTSYCKLDQLNIKCGENKK